MHSSGQDPIGCPEDLRAEKEQDILGYREDDDNGEHPFDCLCRYVILATGFHANAAMRVDPVLKNTGLVDLVGGSAVFYQSQVKLVKV